MCGILGIAGDEGISTTQLFCRLKRLEYRGYDSCGLAGYDTAWNIQKYIGKVSSALKEEQNPAYHKASISHTRWATHGEVNLINTHPHLSYDESLSLVHNGVIENYQEIKSFLQKKGIVHKSDTDTEVISNLLAYNLRQVINFKKFSILEALEICLRQLKGSYAIAFIHVNEPDTIYYAKNQSPLVLGKSLTHKYISSDIYTFIDDTNFVMYLNDKDYGYVNSDGVCRFNLNKEKVIQNKWTEITASYDEVDLGDYQHYMIKEICEQQNLIQNTIASKSLDEIHKIINLINKADRVIFTGCGSSYYASMVAARFLWSNQIRASCILSSEFESFEGTINENDLIICVSQSGETADIIESINIAHSKSCKILSIINVENSTIDRLSDYSIYLNAGPEICVLSTKSFTSQVGLFALIFKHLSQQGLSFHAVQNSIYELISESTRNSVRKIAERIFEKEHIYCLGKGLQYPVALEAALKIKEVSYIHAEGFAGGELKHGSIALIEEGTPCILFLNKAHQLELLANGAELKSRGAVIIGVGEENNDLFDYFIRVRGADLTLPILQIIPIQLMAYNLALLKGLDPDKPRNLAKSVTVK